MLREQHAPSMAAVDSVVRSANGGNSSGRVFKVAGLFAGIGGIELGLQRAGHHAELLCEIDPLAHAVLDQQFPNVPKHGDIARLAQLPAQVDLLVGGFPCQDLSQAGMTRGLQGENSSLVHHVFRLLRDRPVPWLVLENVPFMLQLARGHAMEYLIDQLEALEYKWAYRVVDTRSFGLPHRRRRVFVVASKDEDPRTVLFADDAGEPTRADTDWREHACGFYWTEGTRGLGWALDSIPTLKGGSGLGIPSAPAVVMPDGVVVTPTIEVAEALQGFPRGWTLAAAEVGRPGFRWKLVGNAVSVPVAEWVGRRLARPGRSLLGTATALRRGSPWPTAAFNVGNGWHAAHISEWPKARKQRQSLNQYLVKDQHRRLLSRKATAGFLKRAKASSLHFPDGFFDVLDQHLKRVGGSLS